MHLPNKLKKIILIFFPWSSLAKSNKLLKEKINNIIQDNDFSSHADYMRGYEKLSYDQIKEFYDQTLNAKKSLEDKLKTSLFSVTVGITVMTSTGTFLLNDSVSSLRVPVKVALFFSGFTAATYMIIAGILSIRTISGHLAVYQLFPENIVDITRREKKKRTAICAELNSLSNIIRQNLMNASFHCIINSLFFMAVFIILLGIASLLETKQVKESIKVEIISQPTQDKIDLIVSEIYKQNSENKILLKEIKSDIQSYNQNFSKLSSSVNKINKEISKKKLSLNKKSTRKSINAKKALIIKNHGNKEFSSCLNGSLN